MPADARPLKLTATDEKDLAVVSGALQDAIVPIGDMAYWPADNAFVFVANRFRWEAGYAGGNAERINAGVSFANVMDVKRRAIDFLDRGQFLNLLSISCEAGSGPGLPSVQLTFSGDTAIRLQTNGLLCRMEDFGEPWPTHWRPEHGDQ